MAAQAFVTMVEGPDTPDRYRQHVGRLIPYTFGPIMPVGPGMLDGVPGHMEQRGGDWVWVIHEVDMRSDEVKKLDEARELLRQKPASGERISDATERLLRAAWLVIEAQEAVTRRQATQGRWGW